MLPMFWCMIEKSASYATATTTIFGPKDNRFLLCLYEKISLNLGHFIFMNVC